MSVASRAVAFRGSALARRLAPRAARHRRGPAPRGPSRASSDDDARSSSSSAPWWSLLDRVHILVFNPEEPDEAVYTTSRRTDDAASNDFVAFESLQDASRACVRVSDQLGEMPVVDSVDPRVVAFLADACGYGVDAVPAGAPFEPPEVIIDETDGSLAGGVLDDGELAISTADLRRYVAGADDEYTNDEGGPEDHFDAAEEDDTDDSALELEAARRRAASAVSGALRAPAAGIRGAVAGAAAAPARAMRTPMRVVTRAMRDAAGAPREGARLDPAWDERVHMPDAARAMYRALIVIAGERLAEAGEEEEKAEGE